MSLGTPPSFPGFSGLNCLPPENIALVPSGDFQRITNSTPVAGFSGSNNPIVPCNIRGFSCDAGLFPAWQPRLSAFGSSLELCDNANDVMVFMEDPADTVQFDVITVGWTLGGVAPPSAIFTGPGILGVHGDSFYFVADHANQNFIALGG